MPKPTASYTKTSFDSPTDLVSTAQPQLSTNVDLSQQVLTESRDIAYANTGEGIQIVSGAVKVNVLPTDNITIDCGVWN